MSDAERRIANRVVLERAMAAIGTGDRATLAGLYTEDWVLELPFGDPPRRLEGAEEIAAYLGPQMGRFEFTLSLVEVHFCVDPDLLVAEYTSEGRAAATGKPYRNTYIGLWRFRDGRICGVKEYLNPMVVAEALTPDDPQDTPGDGP